jgi:hypothetical protein
MLSIKPDIPISLYTGFSDVISVEETKADGSREYMVRPIAITDPAQSIRTILDINKCKTLEN